MTELTPLERRLLTRSASRGAPRGAVEVWQHASGRADARGSDSQRHVASANGSVSSLRQHPPGERARRSIALVAAAAVLVAVGGVLLVATNSANDQAALNTGSGGETYALLDTSEVPYELVQASEAPLADGPPPSTTLTVLSSPNGEDSLAASVTDGSGAETWLNQFAEAEEPETVPGRPNARLSPASPPQFPIWLYVEPMSNGHEIRVAARDVDPNWFRAHAAELASGYASSGDLALENFHEVFSGLDASGSAPSLSGQAMATYALNDLTTAIDVVTRPKVPFDPDALAWSLADTTTVRAESNTEFLVGVHWDGRVRATAEVGGSTVIASARVAEMVVGDTTQQQRERELDALTAVLDHLVFVTSDKWPGPINPPDETFNTTSTTGG